MNEHIMSSCCFHDPLAPENRPVLCATGLIAVFMLFLHGSLPAGHHVLAFCGQVGLTDLTNTSLLRAMIWSPLTLMVGWGIMLFVMMLPLTAGQLTLLWTQNQGINRIWAPFWFLCGYLGVWMAAGLIIVPLGLANRILYTDNTPIIVAVGVAVVWSTIAIMRRNTCSWSSDVKHLRGVRAGGACVAQCWPWMLVPSAFQTGHDTAMIVVTLIVLFLRSYAARPRPIYLVSKAQHFLSIRNPDF